MSAELNKHVTTDESLEQKLAVNTHDLFGAPPGEALLPGTDGSSRQALHDAFSAFNQISNQLASSYHALEQQVAHLNDELNKSHESRLRELTEKERLANRLSTLLQALPGGVVVLDSDGKIQEFNPTALDYLGEPLENQYWSDVIKRAFSPKSDDGHDVSLADGRRVNISTCPLINEPGQILLITDVSEMRDLQDKLNQRERLAAMGEMAASLAHQIRTPLSSAVLYTSNLKRVGLAEADFNRYTTKIKDRLDHLEHIVNDMLLYSRSNTTGRDDEFTMESFLAELELLLDEQILKSRINFHWKNSAGEKLVTANRQMLLSALLNLCVNAIQAMQGTGNLKVLSRLASETSLEILVCDDGPGIGDEKLSNIFDPFFTTRNDGTGLGLAVVRAIIHAHKGEVIVDTETGVGTTFIVQIPLLEINKNNSENDLLTDPKISDAVLMRG